jgi:aspartate racemase
MALEVGAEPLPLPFLHIAEVLGDQAKQRGFRRVGILGTRWTMEGRVYPDALERRGIDWAVPPAEVQGRLHAHIMDELCLGIRTPECVAAFIDAAESLHQRGCDAVAAVCTEIPLVLTDANSPVPVLDSTRSLARAAVAVALGDEPFPTWRGGPIDSQG